MFDTLTELMEARAIKDRRSVSWNTICETEGLSETFLRDNASLVNWYLVSGHQQLSENFIHEFSGRLYWDEIIRTQKLSESFIEEFADSGKWTQATEKLSKRQLKTWESEGSPFNAKQYWEIVSRKKELLNSKGLSPAFIEKHSDKLSWPSLSACQQLPMSLIDRHAHRVDWVAITRNQVLSELFIEKHRNKVEWETITFHQQLSERFINRHHAKMSFISAEEKRSEAFIYTHLDKMDAATLIEHQDFRTIKNYVPMDVYVIAKNGRKKYILRFKGPDENGLPDYCKVDEEELFEILQEYGLEERIEADFPELLVGEGTGY
ncbi:hypothetical protein [Planococcus sp. CAU13]|uniref:hypothetical protein n=1 Tax=Planococcus sp. CAU13 TaxID=1541197 RepID=UPI00052FDD76|nr:hypothetical protein [Planococcus sp. CAU13]